MKDWNYWLCRLLEFALGSLVAITVAVVLWGVLSRFVINVSSRWTEELASILLTWMAILGASVAFRQKQHLGVDYFYQKIDPDAQRWCAVIVQLIILAFAAVVMVAGGITLVYKTLLTGQVTAALGIRMGLVYLALPISGLSIVMFCVEEIAQLVATPTAYPPRSEAAAQDSPLDQ